MNPLWLLVQIGLFGVASLTAVMLSMLIESAIDYARDRQDQRQLGVSAAYLLGTIIGGLASWEAIALAGWQLTFWATLKASVDSATYTHRVEHASENILVLLSFVATACGVVCAAFSGRRSPFSARAERPSPRAV